MHILSQFYDRYQQTRDRIETVRSVVRDLFRPMLFTSLTTAAGFASLALTPIPPVQVFGIFVAFGVMVAWFLTITLLPAYIALMSESTLASFGMPGGPGGPSRNRRIAAVLDWMGEATYKYAKPVLLLTLLISVAAIVGISRIQVNDNPIRWFSPDHDIRVADRVLNQHFGGSYMAYLALTPTGYATDQAYLADLHTRTTQWAGEEECAIFDALRDEVGRLRTQNPDQADPLPHLESFAQANAMGTDGAEAAAWERVLDYLSQESAQRQVFKHPDVLTYIAGLQRHLETMDVIGKTNTAADMVKTIHRELLGGSDDQYRIPNSSSAVAQTLLTYQNSHRPQDLWHFLTPDFRTAAIWIQMKSGDNADMMRLVETVDRYFSDHSPPTELAHRWFGLTYINSVWQEKMVNGMLEALAGSFIVVFLMMTLLMRSALWALLGMLPLAVTLAAIYGAIGLLGKDYDMPVAVLSALSLGLAVDFAIHFLEQARRKVAKQGSWKAAAPLVFGAPARAITRNGLVVAIGFLPLLAAPLVPYQTVGTLIAAILTASGAATLVVLPALIRTLEPWLFRKHQRTEGIEISTPVVQSS